MNKFITLGAVEAAFNHDYETVHLNNKRTGEISVVQMPRATTATIKVGDEEFIGHASCSHKDMFSYEKGRKLALKAAFSEEKSLSKEERRRFWEEYNKLKKGGRW